MHFFFEGDHFGADEIREAELHVHRELRAQVQAARVPCDAHHAAEPSKGAVLARVANRLKITWAGAGYP